MFVCGLATILTACSTNNPEAVGTEQIESVVAQRTESGIETVTSASSVVSVTSEKTAEETTESATQDLRTVAEGYIGGNCADLIQVIGYGYGLHPAGGLNDDGNHYGYLAYDDFAIEFESEDESYLENGDYSKCTVTAVIDNIFD